MKRTFGAGHDDPWSEVNLNFCFIEFRLLEIQLAPRMLQDFREFGEGLDFFAPVVGSAVGAESDDGAARVSWRFVFRLIESRGPGEGSFRTQSNGTNRQLKCWNFGENDVRTLPTKRRTNALWPNAVRPWSPISGND